MPKQYEVLYPRPYQSAQGEQTHWMHIGKAFEAKGGGLDVILYVLPPPDANGKGYRVLVREELPERQQQRQQQRTQGGPPQHRDRGSFQGGGYGPQRGGQDEVPMPGGDTDDIPF